MEYASYKLREQVGREAGQQYAAVRLVPFGLIYLKKQCPRSNHNDRQYRPVSKNFYKNFIHKKYYTLLSYIRYGQVCYNNPMDKPTQNTSNATLNRLRAAVLGANDGIVSTSSVLMGVAGATNDSKTLFTAGMAALVAGALSMAVGEYVSVSSQRDAEKVDHENAHPHDEHEFTSPTQAAVASLIAFTVGGLIPFLAVIFAPSSTKIPVTVLAVVLALILTGYGSATVGGASRRRAVMRVVVGGLIAMAVTYYIGALFGATFI